VGFDDSGRRERREGICLKCGERHSHASRAGHHQWQPKSHEQTQIAKNYLVVANTAAVILGPTGLAYDAQEDVLYVASTADNEIFAVPNAGSRPAPPSNGTGTVIFNGQQLRGPLALVLAPNGDLITSNGDAVNADVNHPSEIVEFTKDGKFIGQFNVDPAQGGAFGIAVESLGDNQARFAAVDDNTNDISVYLLRTED
jgi:hypothetical protein